MASYCDTLSRHSEEQNQRAHSDLPARRFKSSLLGGEIPYGASNRSILSAAQRKEYPPTAPKESEEVQPTAAESPKILPEPAIVNLSKPQPEEPSAEPVVRCSVIQRVPVIVAKEKDNQTLERPLAQTPLRLHEPEQEHPIDYHIPKRRDPASNGDEDDEDKKVRQSEKVCVVFFIILKSLSSLS